MKKAAGLSLVRPLCIEIGVSLFKRFYYKTISSKVHSKNLHGKFYFGQRGRAIYRQVKAPERHSFSVRAALNRKPCGGRRPLCTCANSLFKMPATTSTPPAPRRARIRSRSAISRVESRLAQTSEYFRVVAAGQLGQVLPPKANPGGYPIPTRISTGNADGLGIIIEGVHRGVAELGGGDGQNSGPGADVQTRLRLARAAAAPPVGAGKRPSSGAGPCRSSARGRARPPPALFAGDAGSSSA